MITNKLPPDIQNYILNDLIVDKQFQKRFKQDKILDYLQAQKHNKDIQFQQLQLVLNRANYVKRERKVEQKKHFLNFLYKLFHKHENKQDSGIFFRPITLALFSYLYTLKSNIICNVNNIDIVDLDMFFYLLQTKDYNYDYKSVLIKSCDYCKNVLKLSYRQIAEIFNRIYSIQFKVFSLFPRIGDDSQEPHFNVDWMLGILSKIKPYVSYTTQELYTQISLSQIYYYYAQFLKNNGDNSVFVRNDQEILDEMDNRTIDLVIERLIQKGILKKEQRKEYFKLMKYTKEKTNG